MKAAIFVACASEAVQHALNFASACRQLPTDSSHNSSNNNHWQQQQVKTTTTSLKWQQAKAKTFAARQQLPQQPPPVVASEVAAVAAAAATVTAFIHFIWKANICAHFKSSSSCSSTFNSISISSFPLSFIFSALISMQNWMQNPNLNSVATAKNFSLSICHELLISSTRK